jgi:hypothetical protein
MCELLIQMQTQDIVFGFATASFYKSKESPRPKRRDRVAIPFATGGQANRLGMVRSRYDSRLRFRRLRA